MSWLACEYWKLNAVWGGEDRSDHMVGCIHFFWWNCIANRFGAELIKKLIYHQIWALVANISRMLRAEFAQTYILSENRNVNPLNEFHATSAHFTEHIQSVLIIGLKSLSGLTGVKGPTLSATLAWAIYTLIEHAIFTHFSSCRTRTRTINTSNWKDSESNNLLTELMRTRNMHLRAYICV